jgi:hypothetical protein
MAIIFDNSQQGSGNYTVGVGTNPYLLVMTAAYDSGSNPGVCSYDSIAMDLVVNLGTVSSGSSYPGLFVFGLANPPQGSSLGISATHPVFCVASYIGARSVYPVYQHANGIFSSIQEVDMFITPDTSDSWALSFGGEASSIVSALTDREDTFGSTGFYFGDSNGGGIASPYEVAINTVANQYYQYCTFLLSTTPPPIRVPGTPAFLTRFM